jgi:hypothetical protein
MAFKVGDHVGGHYRSATWTGRIKSIVHQGTTDATTEFAIKPDADSKHPGEPTLIHRFGKNIHRVS